jgi:hypothetical protein
MTLISRVLLIAALIVAPLPALAESAVVKSAVNIRTAPSSSKSRVVGTLKAGEELTVNCSNRGWCELADGRGFVAKSFLRLGAGGGGTTKAAAAPEPTPAAATETAAAPEPAAPPAPETGGIFDGTWTAATDQGAEGTLQIAQIDTDAEATMVAGDITTKMTGRIEGMRYIFSWQNVRDGKVLVEGDGFLNFVGDNALSGALMRDGALLAAIKAGR